MRGAARLDALLRPLNRDRQAALWGRTAPPCTPPVPASGTSVPQSPAAAGARRHAAFAAACLRPPARALCGNGTGRPKGGSTLLAVQ